jgi:hypothetical protein
MFPAADHGLRNDGTVEAGRELGYIPNFTGGVADLPPSAHLGRVDPQDRICSDGFDAEPNRAHSQVQ